MPFTESEIADHTELIENKSWSRRRPPLELRDRIREGQRIDGLAIELFFVRPAFRDPDETIEDPIAKLQHVRRRDVWRIYWMRGDLKWHRYPPCPQVTSLEEALRIIDEDAHGCLFG